MPPAPNHFAPLVALEFRRQRRPFLTNAAFAALCLATVLLTGHATVQNLTAILCGIAGTYAVLIPATLLRDLHEGTLAIFTALPVSARTQAESRLFVALTLNGVGALQCGAAAVLGVRTAVPLTIAGGAAVFAVATLVAWIALASFSAAAITLLARLSFDAAMRLPAAVFMLVLVLAWAVDHLLPAGTGAYLARAAASAWALPTAATLCLAGLALVGTAAVRITATGLARYQPPRVT